MSITLCQLYCLNLTIAARYSFNFSLWPLSRAWLSSSIALLATCFACSTFMFVLLFRGAIAPFTGSRGSNTETGDKSVEVAASRSERVAGRMTPGFGGVRRASEDRRRDELHAGRETDRSGQRGEQAESQAKTETALFGVKIRRGFVGLHKTRTQ